MRPPKRLFIKDMSPEQIAEVERRMMHRQFLAQGDSLVDIINSDAKILGGSGITHQQIADRLESLSQGALWQWKQGNGISEGQGYGAIIGGKYKVYAFDWCSGTACPYSNEGNATCGKGEHTYIILNQETGEPVKFEEILIHLVRDHHFFEGNTQFRLDPRIVIRVLDLKPGVDYTPKTETEVFWQGGWGYSPNVGEDLRETGAVQMNPERMYGSQEIIGNPDRVINVVPGAQIHLKGKKGILVAPEEIQVPGPLIVDGGLYEPENNLIPRGQTVLARRVNTYVVG